VIQAGEDEKGSKVDLSLFGSTTDPDSSAFTFQLVGKAPTGVTLDPNGILHLDPAGHYESLSKGQMFTADVSFSVSDGAATSSAQTFTFQVIGANEVTLAARDVMTSEGAFSEHAASGGGTMGAAAIFTHVDALVPVADAI